VGALGDIAALFQRSGVPASRVGATVDRTQRAGAAVGHSRGAVRELFTELHTFVSEWPGQSVADYTQLRLTPGARHDRAWRAVEDAWATLRERWLDVAKQCAELLADLEDLANGADDAPEPGSGRPGADGIAQTANDLLAELEGFL